MASNRVNVFCRSRPLLEREMGDITAVEMMSEDLQVVVRQTADPLMQLNKEAAEKAALETKEKSFKLDGVFDPTANQKEIFQRVGLPVLVDVMQGFNGTIFAYGQTGSGKTYSLLNTEVSDLEQVGILPRLIATLFARAAMDKSYVYAIQCAGFQVYNEQVDDLLHPEFKQGKGQNLSVSKGSVSNLTWNEVKNASDTLDLFRKARNGLHYAETRMNKASSRSHAVFQMRIVRRQRSQQGTGLNGATSMQVQATCGQLSVVDLAGSERVKRSGVTGANFKEATNINGSLLALGNVIQALAEKRKHVPFRDSKLTRILESSVGGNCKTSLLVCVSPAETSTSETLSTLEFANRAMKVECDAKINETMVEIDAARLAADMEENDGAAFVDEEMMKTYKESEKALADANARMAEQEKHAESLKAEVSEVHSQLQAKEMEMSEILKDSQKQASQIDVLKQELVQTEAKHQKELEKSEYVQRQLKTQVAQAEKEIQQTKLNLQKLTVKHQKEQQEKKEIKAKLEALEKQMSLKAASTSQAMELLQKEKDNCKNEFQEKLQQEKLEQAKLQQEIESERQRSIELESSISSLALEKENLGSNLNAMNTRVESITNLLTLEKEKVCKLQEIQVEAQTLKVELESFKKKEETLLGQLKSIQEERGNLSGHVMELEVSCAKLEQNYDSEAKLRQRLEQEKTMLQEELSATADNLVEKHRELDTMKTSYENELNALKELHATTIRDTRRKSIEDQERSAKHASEAMQALEHRAREDQRKMQEKLTAMDNLLKERQSEHEKEIAALKTAHAEEMATRIGLEREAHERETDRLKTQIAKGVQEMVEAEKQHLQRDQRREEEHSAKLKYAQAAHETARAAIKAQLAEANQKYSTLHARFTARESRKEDLQLIATQQKELSDMRRSVKHAKRITKQKQLELDHVIDNVRIFGTEHDNAKQKTTILPGQKIGERNSFLNRRAKAPQENITLAKARQQAKQQQFLIPRQDSNNPVIHKQKASATTTRDEVPQSNAKRRPLPTPPI